jgi:hypothetical protein
VYPIMRSNRFISEIMHYNSISLGHREEQFLDMIANGQTSEGNDFYYSAYDIYRELNGGEGHKGKGRKLPDFYPIGAYDSISYKDVHKRVKRLEFLGLIESINVDIDKQKKRKVIKYKVTSRGLFQCCLYFQLAPRRPTKLPLMSLYKDNVIFQTLVYQYFQEETVKEILSIFKYDFLFHYLRKCCEGILTILENLPSFEMNENFKTAWPHYYLEKLITHRELMVESRIGDIERLIKNQLKRLIYDLLVELNNDIYKDNFPNRVLRDDKQLFQTAQELKKEFNDGFNTLFCL